MNLGELLENIVKQIEKTSKKESEIRKFPEEPSIDKRIRNFSKSLYKSSKFSFLMLNNSIYFCKDLVFKGSLFKKGKIDAKRIAKIQGI